MSEEARLAESLSAAMKQRDDLYERITELNREVERLKEKYEGKAPKCNRGHENNLPLALWNCPMCTDHHSKDNVVMLAQIQWFRGMIRQGDIKVPAAIAEHLNTVITEIESR